MLLAFDTATALVSVALHDGGDVLCEHVSTQPMKHGEFLAPLVQTCLEEAGASSTDITSIAVGVGPGPFTGLRVGIVTARTLGHVLDVPVHGVCTLDVLAQEAVATGVVDTDFLVATDARRKEVYAATYDASGRRTSGPTVDKPDVFKTTVSVVGVGADLYPDAFPNSVGPRQPSAGWLARSVIGQRVELLDPEPLYLRRPDAVAGSPRKPVS